MPANDLNLIPDDVLRERSTTVRKSSGLRLGILLIIIVGAISVALIGYNQYLQKQVRAYKSDIAEKNKKIEELRDFGKEGYSLGVRLESIEKLLNERPNFSTLVDEIHSKTPDQVIVQNYSFTGQNDISLSGIAYPNYTPIAEFQDNLLKEMKDPSVDKDKVIFTDVSIGSANYNKENGTVSFTFRISYNSDALKDEVTKKAKRQQPR